jgi:hypothetical protein
MSHKPLFAFLAVAIICLASAKQTKADTITITFTNPNQSGTPGSTLVYNGVITNSGPVSTTVSGAGMTYAGGTLLFESSLFSPRPSATFYPLPWRRGRARVKSRWRLSPSIPATTARSPRLSS